MSLTIRELQDAIKKRSEESFHKVEEWSATDYVCCLAEEVGEVAAAIKRIRRMGDGQDRAYNRGADVDKLTELAGKELADVIIYCGLLASRINLDLDSAVRQKFNEVSERVGNKMRL